MNQFLPFVVIGLTTGSVYAMAAIGVVLTYKTSRVFNFAYGSFAAVISLFFFALVFRGDIPWRWAFALTVLGVAPALGVAFEVLARRLGPLTTEAKVLATIGLLLALEGATALWGSDAYSSHFRGTPPSLPRDVVRIFRVNVGSDEIIIVIVGLVMAGLLHLLLERTSIGRSMRAVVDNRELLSMLGRNPRAVLRSSWAIGFGFVGLSGLLLVLSPSYTVSVGTLPTLVLQAFGAAAIGGFTNLPLTYAGGIAIGIISALSTKYIGQFSWLIGLPASIPFIVLFVVLLIRPRHLAPERTELAVVSPRRVLEVSRVWRWILDAALVAGLLRIATSGSLHLVYVANLAVGYAVIFLGLGLLIRTSGQVSLCQMGLAAVGATTFVRAADSAGIPWFGALLLGGLAAAVVGVIVAIPAIRVAGIYLALATFGFGILLEQMVYPTVLMFSEGAPRSAPRPIIGPLNSNNDTTYFFVCLAVFALAFLLVAGIKRARLGRLLSALRDSPISLATEGASINTARVAVFAISAFLAGVGGALIVGQDRVLESGPFDSTNSLLLVAILLTLRLSEPFSSMLAAAALAIVPSFLSGRLQVWWLNIGFGVGAVLVGANILPQWLPRLRWAPSPGWQLKLRRETTSRSNSRTTPSSSPASGLTIRGLRVEFGTVVAIENLDLDAPMGEVTGLIGPNGAGKTTTFDFCSGLAGAVNGTLSLNGRDLSHLRTAARARLGLGRTFQRVELFDSLTVRENVSLGLEAGLAGVHVAAHIVALPGQTDLVRAAASDAMEMVGVAPLAKREVDTLSTSEKRLVELARCLSGNFVFLLLDEPSSGLDAEETHQFGEVLRRVVCERGIGVLLVEHDMSLVKEVCSRIYALDFGRLIYAGSAADAWESRAVQEAYLGVLPSIDLPENSLYRGPAST